MEKVHKETLSVLQEECAEVIVAISKIFRFGLDGKKPDIDQTNIQHLEEEIGDLICMVEILEAQGLISASNVRTAVANKQEKLKKWTKILK